jgi:DNA-binding IclR family transcriptional regulator
MARRSPQTERLVEMVEFLADRTGAFRLADLARLVDADKATCLPMLAELTRVGWLVKDPRKRTYRLGPKLVGIGAAAAHSLEIAEAARPELVALSEEMDCATGMLMPSGDDLVIAEWINHRERAAPMDLGPGDRVAFQPPIGAILVAWSNFYQQNVWLNRDPVVAADPHTYLARLDALRESRFAVEQYPVSPTVMRPDSSRADTEFYGERRAAWLSDAMRRTPLDDMLVTTIVEARYYEILGVSAAVFDAAGSPVSTVGIADPAKPVLGAELHAIGERVALAAEKVTEHIGGQLAWKVSKPRCSG